MSSKPTQKTAGSNKKEGFAPVGRRTFLKLAATSTTVGVPALAGLHITSQPVVAEVNGEVVPDAVGATEPIHQPVVAGQVNSFALNGDTQFTIQWDDMVRGDIIDLEMFVKLDQIDGMEATTTAGDKMQYEPIGRMGVQVPSSSGSKQVKGSDFFLNRKSVDITNHPDIELDHFNIDLENTTDYQKEVDFTVKLVGTAPNDSHQFVKVWEYNLTVEAILGLGIALGQALGVGNGN